MRQTGAVPKRVFFQPARAVRLPSQRAGYLPSISLKFPDCFTKRPSLIRKSRAQARKTSKIRHSRAPPSVASRACLSSGMD
jgi:hypothetical protein